MMLEFVPNGPKSHTILRGGKHLGFTLSHCGVQQVFFESGYVTLAELKLIVAEMTGETTKCKGCGLEILSGVYCQACWDGHGREDFPIDNEE